jgi:hypothetical protein
MVPSSAMMHIFLHGFVSELSLPMLDLNSLGRYQLPYHIKLTFLFRTQLLQSKGHRGAVLAWHSLRWARRATLSIKVSGMEYGLTENLVKLKTGSILESREGQSQAGSGLYFYGWFQTVDPLPARAAQSCLSW